MVVWWMFAGGLLIFSQPLGKSSITVQMSLFIQMHLKQAGVLKLTMATTRVVPGQSLSHSDTNYLELLAVKLALASLF